MITLDRRSVTSIGLGIGLVLGGCVSPTDETAAEASAALSEEDPAIAGQDSEEAIPGEAEVAEDEAAPEDLAGEGAMTPEELARAGEMAPEDLPEGELTPKELKDEDEGAPVTQEGPDGAVGERQDKILIGRRGWGWGRGFVGPGFYGRRVIGRGFYGGGFVGPGFYGRRVIGPGFYGSSWGSASHCGLYGCVGNVW